MIEFIKGMLRKSFIKYLVVGGTSFVLDYGLFYLLHELTGLRAVYANAISVFTAFWYNFFLNRLWSFGSNEPILRQLVLYLSLMFFNMFFSSGFIYLMKSLLDIDEMISKILAMCIIVGWNFVFYKKFIFIKTANKKI